MTSQCRLQPFPTLQAGGGEGTRGKKRRLEEKDNLETDRD